MLKVLVVEDEELIRKGVVLTVDWASLGYEVAGEAANGQEGLELAEKLSPDLIITDLKMPKLDGLAMLRRLREQGSEAKVIILTAYESFEYAREALRLGAVDFLIKPFHDGDLEHAIRAMGRTREAPLPVPGVKEGEKSRYVSEAMDFVSTHYADPGISVGGIARSLGISEGHLSHIFKAETGLTPLGYLTSYRHVKATELLRDGKLRVYEVAERVGYRDITYFSTTFKKFAGVTPKEFQEQSRKEK